MFGGSVGLGGAVFPGWWALLQIVARSRRLTGCGADSGLCGAIGRTTCYRQWARRVGCRVVGPIAVCRALSVAQPAIGRAGSPGGPPGGVRVPPGGAAEVARQCVGGCPGWVALECGHCAAGNRLPAAGSSQSMTQSSHSTIPARPLQESGSVARQEPRAAAPGEPPAGTLTEFPRIVAVLPSGSTGTITQPGDANHMHPTTREPHALLDPRTRRTGVPAGFAR